jgi:predicted nucleic acid-binding protein
MNPASERIDALIVQLQACGEYVDFVPSVYINPFDRDDSRYVDLAVRGAASIVTSRDKHMLRLMDQSLPEGRDFHDRFRDLIVVTPEDLLKRLREDRAE